MGPLEDVELWMDCPAPHSANTFALRVRGDSMTAPSGASRTYPDGCIIFVDSERRSPVNGARVVACLRDTNSVTFKVYKNEDGRQWLQPLNPLHEPIRDIFHILGTVIGKWEDG
jgi:SOS-response transcriptional repressor LexA